MIEFTEDQIQRYSRHILLQDVGVEGQERIMNARVLVVGAGLRQVLAPSVSWMRMSWI